MTKYVAPDGHYDFHQDGNGYTRENINDSVRKLSMSCLLNDANDFDGGVLQTHTSGGIDDIEMNDELVRTVKSCLPSKYFNRGMLGWAMHLIGNKSRPKRLVK